MKFALAIALAMFAGAANACDRYVSELSEEGSRTAAYDEEGNLTVTDHGRPTRYYIVSAGTGFPYRVAVPESGDGKALAVREFKGVLLIDMEVFEPMCK